MGPTTVIPARMGPVTQVETFPPTKVETVTIPPTRIPTSLSMTTMSLAEICALPSDTGRCKASFEYWFYDPQSDSCKIFIYGGCGGNDNRWPTKDGCMNACSSSSTPAGFLFLSHIIYLSMNIYLWMNIHLSMNISLSMNVIYLSMNVSIIMLLE